MLNAVPEVSVQDLHQMKQNNDDFLLLDVRRTDEHEYANIEGTLIPLDELPHRIDELDEHKDRKLVVYCRSGGRSAQAVRFLRSMGFDALNLRGGIAAWSREIDPDVPMY